MKATEHPSYLEEEKKLNETKSWLQKEVQRLEVEDESLKAEIARLRKEVSSALDERLVLKLQMEAATGQDLDHLNRVRLSPYFGRINFKEHFQEQVETVYIGKFGLYDAKAGEMLVLDWRTPMANIYYSGLDEEVSYRAPDGLIEGKMLLKRRYVIEQGELSEILDEKSLQDNLKDSIQDGFLIESLNKSTSGRLTEIVATIQEEQNRIIRSEAFLPLVVQGVAGSGKTTIALHRMAYLIYNAQAQEAHYMVVAPNQLFLNYISDILPDLGANQVFQTTFEAWALKQLGTKLKLINKADDKLDELLTSEVAEAEVLALGSKLRGSLLFKKIIDLKLKQLEKSLIPKAPICFEDFVILRYREIQEIFLKSNEHLPYKRRIDLLGSYIKQKLRDKEEVIKQGIEASYRGKLRQLKESVSDIESVRGQIIALFDERDEKIKGIKKWINTYVKDYIKAIPMPSTKDFYQALFEDEAYLIKLLEGKVEGEALQKVIAYLKQIYETGKVETEDLGPLVYLQMKLYGIADQNKYAHIVVDEAQDLDEMKLTVLRNISANDSFTLVGDISQGIYGYKGINNWQRMMTRVFEDKKYHYYEMTTSYRSSIEIIELANKVISRCKEFQPTLAQPVLRHGKEPSLVACRDEEERLEKISESIKRLQAEGMVSICVLTKDLATSQRVYEALLAKGQELQCIDSETNTYIGEVAVTTGYLSKGLEFDAVLVYDVSEETMPENALNIKLLYVMITRALHCLELYYSESLTTILN